MLLASFIAFLLMFACIGLASARVSKGSVGDYYLASRSVKAWLVGLSAVATNNSGYMFIGVIGYTYVEGLASVWLMIGWLVGDFVGSTFAHNRLRGAAKANGDVSYISVLNNWNGQGAPYLQRLMGLLALTFLLAYASAQLVAGSKALFVLLDWPTYLGATVGAVIIMGYCLAGGIRASIWTDAAQSFVMILAMSILLVVAVAGVGGVGDAIAKMDAIPHYLSVMPQDLVVPGWGGLGLFVLGWFVAGLSVIGQPHIMVRFMALEDTRRYNVARYWYYSWFTIFYCMATAVGMLARILLPDVDAFDAELALPTLALKMLPTVLVGLILAGIFAATMSTADSLVLSCSSTLSHDIFPASDKFTPKQKLIIAKLATVTIAIAALVWALTNKQSVFGLVLMAWSTLGSAFAPLLIVLAFGAKPIASTRAAMIASGVAACLLWRYFGLQGAIFEGVAGISAALIIFLVHTYIIRRAAAKAA